MYGEQKKANLFWWLSHYLFCFVFSAYMWQSIFNLKLKNIFITRSVELRYCRQFKQKPYRKCFRGVLHIFCSILTVYSVGYILCCLISWFLPFSRQFLSFFYLTFVLLLSVNFIFSFAAFEQGPRGFAVSYLHACLLLNPHGISTVVLPWSIPVVSSVSPDKTP